MELPHGGHIPMCWVGYHVFRRLLVRVGSIVVLGTRNPTRALA